MNSLTSRSFTSSVFDAELNGGGFGTCLRQTTLGTPPNLPAATGAALFVSLMLARGANSTMCFAYWFSRAVVWCVHSHHRFVNWPGCRPNSLIASALNGQTALAFSSGARTLDTSCSAFAGSGSATTNGTYSGSPSPSRRVVTTTSCPAVDSNAAMKANMRALGHGWQADWLPFIQRDHYRTLRSPTPRRLLQAPLPIRSVPAVQEFLTQVLFEVIFRAAPSHRRAIE